MNSTALFIGAATLIALTIVTRGAVPNLAVGGLVLMWVGIASLKRNS